MKIWLWVAAIRREQLSGCLKTTTHRPLVGWYVARSKAEVIGHVLVWILDEHIPNDPKKGWEIASPPDVIEINASQMRKALESVE